MGSRPQPLKKTSSEGATANSKVGTSCGHLGGPVSGKETQCPECKKKAAAPASAQKQQKPYEVNVEKQKMTQVLTKVVDRFKKDTRAAEKAALVISSWISRKK